jgi:hypothetical protein
MALRGFTSPWLVARSARAGIYENGKRLDLLPQARAARRLLFGPAGPLNAPRSNAPMGESCRTGRLVRARRCAKDLPTRQTAFRLDGAVRPGLASHRTGLKALSLRGCDGVEMRELTCFFETGAGKSERAILSARDSESTLESSRVHANKNPGAVAGASSVLLATGSVEVADPFCSIVFGTIRWACDVARLHEVIHAIVAHPCNIAVALHDLD